jgi:hypothetical protein
MAMAERSLTEPSVFLECHGALLALPSRRVVRLVLREEVTLKPSSIPGVPLAVVGGRAYTAWNLGQLLELPPVDAAWVLLRIPHEGAELPLALATGRCLLVAPLGREATSLPPGLFRGRHNALWGAFSLAGLGHGKLAGVMGLCLDPLRLWSRQELSLSASALLSERGP